MIQKIFFCTFLCFITFAGYSQQCIYNFKGTITDYHDGTSIFGATIFIKNLNKYITSDDQGKFKIENLCNGEIHLFISTVWCKYHNFRKSARANMHDQVTCCTPIKLKHTPRRQHIHQSKSSSPQPLP